MTALLSKTDLMFDASAPLSPLGNGEEGRKDPRGLDFLGSVPVPLRNRVGDGLARLAALRRSRGAAPLKYCFPRGQGGRSPFERLRFIRDLESYPAMQVSAEYGNAFNSRFYEAHVRSGAFSACQPRPAPPVFADAGLCDPEGWIGVFAVAPFVMLIDHGQLNGVPAPRRWSDLLEPAYRNRIVFGGWRQPGSQRYAHYNKFFLVAMAREYGLDGLARLLRNIPLLLHSAQMPRLAGTGMSPGGVFILPWFLADLCPRRSQTELVWPEDGALAYPLWLTVKSRDRDRLDFLIDHFYGADLGRYLNENRYPSLCPDLPAALPPGARLKWLDWDFVRHRSTAGLVKSVCQLFLDSRNAADPEA
jgi:ABC-type Fe3+ transport system substrate-binding protein